MIRFNLTRALCAAAILALTAVSSTAEPMKVMADLKGTAETPPNTAPGTGTLAGTYDPATKKFSWEVTYSGLTGPATMAHFHAPAPVGKSSGVEIPIKGTVGSPIKGEMTLSEAEAKNLTDGMTYFNVHTDKNPKGELRGQVMVQK